MKPGKDATAADVTLSEDMDKIKIDGKQFVYGGDVSIDANGLDLSIVSTATVWKAGSGYIYFIPSTSVTPAQLIMHSSSMTGGSATTGNNAITFSVAADYSVILEGANTISTYPIALGRTASAENTGTITISGSGSLSVQNCNYPVDLINLVCDGVTLTTNCPYGINMLGNFTAQNHAHINITTTKSSYPCITSISISAKVNLIDSVVELHGKSFGISITKAVPDINGNVLIRNSNVTFDTANGIGRVGNFVIENSQLPAAKAWSVAYTSGSISIDKESEINGMFTAGSKADIYGYLKLASNISSSTTVKIKPGATIEIPTGKVLQFGTATISDVGENVHIINNGTVQLPASVTAEQVEKMNITGTGILQIGGNSSILIDGTIYELGPGNLATSGLELTSDATTTKVFKAGSGYLFWFPEVTESVLSGAEIKLVDATISSNNPFQGAITVPNIPLKIDLVGNSILTPYKGTNAIKNNSTVTINSTDGTGSMTSNAPIAATSVTLNSVSVSCSTVKGNIGMLNGSSLLTTQITGNLTSDNTQNTLVIPSENEAPAPILINGTITAEAPIQLVYDGTLTKDAVLLTSSETVNESLTADKFMLGKEILLNLGKVDNNIQTIEPNKYTVTFDVNGHGTAPEAITNVIEGTKINVPTAPAASGYTFGGWYKEAGCTTAWNFDTDVVNNATTLYAKWTVAASSGGGGGGSSTTTTTTTNSDGSTTTKVTNNTTGTVTETTKGTDGSTTVTETKKDGTVTETVKDTAGNSTVTETKKDGTVTETIKDTTGNSTVTETKTDGTVTETVKDTIGNTTEKVINTDGSVLTTDKKADGLTTVTNTDTNGKTTAEVTVPMTSADAEVKVDVPVKLGDSDGTVSVKITYPDGKTETVKCDYLGNTVSSGNSSNGKVNVPVAGSASIEILDDFVPLSAAPLLPFTDVNADRWSYSNIAYVYDNELFKGISDTEFGPAVSMNRGMLVTVLYRMEKMLSGSEPESAANAGFVDVVSGEYYEAAVNWAYKNGIVTGKDAAHFAPNDEITREQLAAILCRYAALKGYATDAAMGTAGFDDVFEISDYAVSAMTWAVSSGIINGSDNKLMPQGSATREQVAAILQRYCEMVLNKKK